MMKPIFRLNDDWDDNCALINFESKKKLKQKPLISKNLVQLKETVNKFENFKKSKVKVGKNIAKEHIKSNITSEVNFAVSNLLVEPKLKQKRSKPHEQEFDGKCRYTPLLLKNIGSAVEDNSINETVATETLINKKRTKKRKTSFPENGDVKKQKLAETETKLISEPKNGSLNKSFKSIDFANKLRQNLLGGRFRFLNELLYTSTGNIAKKMFEQDKEAFKAYHQGYRQQIEKWPFNPLDRIIKRVRRLPKHMIVADFGCGEAKLADSIPHKCFSIDLVSSKPNVIACDMANTPLQSQSIDLVVFCLSLMGTNLNDFIFEANRILKTDGVVHVAEIASRFDNVKEFKKLWEQHGFELLRQDVDKKNYFYFFDFRKVENIKKNILSISNCTLKPCIYKKR